MNLDRKLKAYTAAAAAAAAVGVAGESTDAATVASPGFTFGIGSTNNINFDNSGNEEYVLGHRTGPNRVQLLKDDQTIDANAYVFNASNNQPDALTAGTLIGPSSSFNNSYDATLANQGDGTGNFLVDDIDGNPQYLGLRFQLADGGPQHYGWVGVDITSATDLTGRVTGFAYEDTPDTAINAGVVPEPAGLALLALGAPFLLRRRGRA
jgi:hypothetical protein